MDKIIYEAALTREKKETQVKHCKEILKSFKIVCHSKNPLDVFIQKLPSRI